MSNKSVGVIGLGHWGTALAEHLSSNGITVIGWSPDKNETLSIRESKKHPSLFPDIKLTFATSEDIEAPLSADYVLLVVPSAALKSAVSKIRGTLQKLKIISAIKGFEKESLKTPLQYIESCGAMSKNLCVLSGPSFAVDVIHGKPCGIVAGSLSEDFAKEVAALFTASSMRVYISTDPLGVELGGSLKNIIAVATGVSDGLGLGDSARAGLMTRGLAEVVRLGKVLGAKEETFYGLSGVGDLAMTASSKTSRNYTVGYRLGQGETLDEILKTLGSVSEGVAIAPLVQDIATKNKVDMPITFALTKLLSGEVGAKEMVKELMTRPVKNER